MSFNFDNVKEASEKIMTQPGTIGVFDITKVEFGESKEKHTKYMKVTFEDKDSSFNHSFFLTEKALSRIQSLVKAVTGKELRGNVTEEQFMILLKGKQIALKVSGQVSNENKGYPQLSFGGFCKPANEAQFLSFNSKEREEIEAAKAAIARTGSSSADKEDTSGGGTPASTEKW